VSEAKSIIGLKTKIAAYHIGQDMGMFGHFYGLDKFHVFVCSNTITNWSCFCPEPLW
jgi:hypothetical protein